MIILLEYFYYKAIKKYLNYKDIDLILFTTPPITFTNLIKKIKKKSNAKTYLLLKDIFPQNAVDLNYLKFDGLLYKFFRNKEIFSSFLYIHQYLDCLGIYTLLLSGICRSRFYSNCVFRISWHLDCCCTAIYLLLCLNSIKAGIDGGQIFHGRNDSLSLLQDSFYPWRYRSSIPFQFFA